MRDMMWFFKKLEKLFLEKQKGKICHPVQLKARKYDIIIAQDCYAQNVMPVSKKYPVMSYNMSRRTYLFIKWLTNDSWLQIYVYSPWYLSSTFHLCKERYARITRLLLVVWFHGAIRIDTMLKAVQFPTSISYLRSSLPNVDRNNLPLNMIKHM